MNLEEIAANSYKNFHSKGLHYICLKRSEKETIKAYFFEGDVTSKAQVVIPHNHRYDFTTKVLAGELTDIEYKEVQPSLGLATRVAQRWDYLTPLNGGGGFQWASESRLWWFKERIVTQGNSLLSPQDRIHTIRVKTDTVLLLTQQEDKLGLETPSQAWSFDGKDNKPDTSGLYDKFNEDEIKAYLTQLDKLGVKA